MSMMLTFRAGKVAALAVFLALVAACSREQQDWRSAEAADTVAGYGQFLERHPDSELATEARTRVAQLSEDREWQRAGSIDTADAYRQFLAQHPNGKWSQEARIRIQNFALNGLPPAELPAGGGAGGTAPAPSASSAASAVVASPGELAKAAPSAPALSTPYVSTPDSAGGSTAYISAANGPSANGTAASVAATSPASAAGSAGYGVQLGAFGSESAASSQWQQLTARFGSELRGLSPHVVPANTSTGLLFRLQAQVADEARARALCDMLRKQSQPCVPVLPH
jgi:hypothetical protein